MNESARMCQRCKAVPARKMFCPACSIENKKELKRSWWRAHRHELKPKPRSQKAWECIDCNIALPRYAKRCAECRRKKESRDTWATQRRKLIAAFQPRKFKCGGCGKTIFVTEYADTRTRFCSDRCLHMAAKRIRRAKTAGVECTYVPPIEIFRRDNYICHICGKMTDKRAKVPALNAPTLDHVIPLALGGSHMRDNLRCAHFICNSKKSATIVSSYTQQVLWCQMVTGGGENVWVAAS